MKEYCKTDIRENGGKRATGGLLSPLCGNVMLNELDKELECRGTDL